MERASESDIGEPQFLNPKFKLTSSTRVVQKKKHPTSAIKTTLSNHDPQFDLHLSSQPERVAEKGLFRKFVDNSARARVYAKSGQLIKSRDTRGISFAF